MKPTHWSKASIIFAVLASSTALAQEGGGDRLGTAQSQVEQMRENQGTVKSLSEKANKSAEEDVIVCVLKKENAVDALVGVSSIALEDLKKALASQQDARADHELRKIQVAADRVAQFTTEAYECFPDQEVASDANVVNLGEVVADDETDEGWDRDVDVGVDPPSTTPFD